MKRLVAPLLIALAALTACGSAEEHPPATTTVAVTTVPSTAVPSSAAAATRQAAKEIDHCATAPDSTPGTTFFTDGSSEWTQYCEDQYLAANPVSTQVAPGTQVPPTTEVAPTTGIRTVNCIDGAVVDQGGGSYSTCVNGAWQHFDPGADQGPGNGLGANEPLPPECVRLNRPC